MPTPYFLQVSAQIARSSTLAVIMKIVGFPLQEIAEKRQRKVLQFVGIDVRFGFDGKFIQFIPLDAGGLRDQNFCFVRVEFGFGRLFGTALAFPRREARAAAARPLEKTTMNNRPAAGKVGWRIATA